MWSPDHARPLLPVRPDAPINGDFASRRITRKGEFTCTTETI